MQDIGGQPPLETDVPLSDAIEASEKPIKFWQFQTHALAYLLSSKKLLTTAQLRRGIEGLPRSAYLKKTYYELWSAAIAAISLERSVITQQDLDQALRAETSPPSIQ